MTDAEEAQWRSIGSPLYPAVNENFGPGELSFRTAEDVRDQIHGLRTREISPGEMLDFLARLLTEAEPTPAAINLAIEIASANPGIQARSEGSMTTLHGLSSDIEGMRIDLTFDQSEGRLVRLRRVATRPLQGLNLDAPIVTYERFNLVAETLGHWAPTALDTSRPQTP